MPITSNPPLIVVYFILLTKCYVSMKSLSERCGSLDNAQLNVTLTSHLTFLMARVMKKLGTLAAILSLGFLFLGLFVNGTLLWTGRYISPLLRVSSDADAKTVRLDMPVKTNGGLILLSYGKLSPHLRAFLGAKENRGPAIRALLRSLPFRGITLVPNVCHYIAKSVLNL